MYTCPNCGKPIQIDSTLNQQEISVNSHSVSCPFCGEEVAIIITDFYCEA
ncbi:MAG: hypothetical protein LBQ68_04670 [Clostridiales bacterium]|nr:hypothetical protein [Clostridiales bacterium]